MPDNLVMLPQLPSLPGFPDIPPSLASFPDALSGNGTWIVMGAVLAVLILWALRRTKRVVVAAAVGVTGLFAAWNAGLLPLVS